MKGKPVDQLVYEQMFPKSRPGDCPNFHVFLQQKLVPEVREEVIHFYGHLDTLEAKYPGLDYSNATHRIRLSRWEWHRELFRAFDELRLTRSEIAGLTKWEGTKWAKDRYEKEQGVTIRDTTSDELADWVPPRERPARAAPRQSSEEAGETAEEETMCEDSEEELASVGAHLNERLRQRVAARNVSGDMNMTLDEEWEQWLKNVFDTGTLPPLADPTYLPNLLDRAAYLHARAAVSSGPPPISATMMEAARAGNWDQIPDVLRPFIRQTLASDRRMSSSPGPLSVPSPATSRVAVAGAAGRETTFTQTARYSSFRRPTRRGAGLRAHRIATTTLVPQGELPWPLGISDLESAQLQHRLQDRSGAWYASRQQASD